MRGYSSARLQLKAMKSSRLPVATSMRRVKSFRKKVMYEITMISRMGMKMRKM